MLHFITLFSVIPLQAAHPEDGSFILQRRSPQPLVVTGCRPGDSIGDISADEFRDRGTKSARLQRK